VEILEPDAEDGKCYDLMTIRQENTFRGLREGRVHGGQSITNDDAGLPVLGGKLTHHCLYFSFLGLEEEEDATDGRLAQDPLSAVVHNIHPRQTIFLPIPWCIPDELKPSDLVGTNKDSYHLEKLPEEFDSRVHGSGRANGGILGYRWV
jgi:hypothetical protein